MKSCRVEFMSEVDDMIVIQFYFISPNLRTPPENTSVYKKVKLNVFW